MVEPSVLSKSINLGLCVLQLDVVFVCFLVLIKSSIYLLSSQWALAALCHTMMSYNHAVGNKTPTSLFSQWVLMSQVIIMVIAKSCGLTSKHKAKPHLLHRGC